MSWLRFNYTLGADYTSDERLEGCPFPHRTFATSAA